MARLDEIKDYLANLRVHRMGADDRDIIGEMQGMMHELVVMVDQEQAMKVNAVSPAEEKPSA